MENRFVKCANYISYTWQHKKAFLRVEKQCRGFNSLRGYLHDVDKLFRYLAFLWGREDWQIQKAHRETSSHHAEYKRHPHTEEDYMLMVIDWECAPLTKPDKPLLAFATMLKWYPQLEARVMPYILKFNLFDEVAINQAVEYQLCSRDEAKQIARRYGWCG